MGGVWGGMQTRGDERGQRKGGREWGGARLVGWLAGGRGEVHRRVSQALGRLAGTTG
jgi:hypothetical protein